MVASENWDAHALQESSLQTASAALRHDGFVQPALSQSLMLAFIMSKPVAAEQQPGPSGGCIQPVMPDCEHSVATDAAMERARSAQSFVIVKVSG